MTADDNAQELKTQDWADLVGKRTSAIFIAALIVMFVYAYLGRLIFG
jgi:hypothetical protein